MNKFEDFEKNLDETRITPDTIFYKLWFSPRLVFRFINKHKYEKHLTLLLMLAGIARVFDRATFHSMGDRSSLLNIILISIIVGSLFGWIIYFIYASTISWTGKWLNGTANPQAVLRVLAYALIPSIVGLVLLIPEILIYGIEVFKAEGDVYSAGIVGNAVYYLCVFIEVILAIWSVVLCIIGISEVQNFSIGKAILNFIFPVVLFVLIIIITSLLFSN